MNANPYFYAWTKDFISVTIIKFSIKFFYAPGAECILTNLYVLTPYVDRGNDKWSRLFKVYWQNFTGLTGLWGLSGL